MSGRDITEGRATRAIAVDLGIQTNAIWQNTGYDYDCAIGGLPFLMAMTNGRAYERGTTPFRKQQFDNQRDPGEQSLQGWWIRSQSSFHTGQGVQFYDPFANPYLTTLASNSYRYNSSFGVNPWTFGQVSLLNRTSKILDTSNAVYMQSVSISGVDKLLVLDTDIKVVDASTSSTLVTHSGTINSMATDGTNVYYTDNGNVYSKALTGGSATTLFTSATSVTSSVMHWVKQRLVGTMNNKIYELVGGTGATLPAATYTHPNAAWKWTDIDEAGTAIYASGYAGGNSAIYRFNLDTTGAMPTLTSGIIAAQLPEGEIIYSLYSHLGAYLCIGTSKGVRIATIDTTGSLTYGPLLVKTSVPVRGFSARDSFIWFGTAVSDGFTNYAGTWRIDLSNEIDTLRFALAQDIYAENTVGGAYDVAFLGTSDRLAFVAATVSGSTETPSLGIWLESTGEKYPSGWLQTGQIRYNTLEQKNFKRIVGRGDFGIAPSSTTTAVTKGSMTLSSVDNKGNLYDIVSYDNVIGTPESTITSPAGAQDSLAIRFTLYRDATDNTLSPIFKGYQLKAVPATPRTRLIKVPLYNFDTESDKYNGTTGWEGRAWARLAALEDVEAAGDVVTFQDFRTGETVQCLIEEISFQNTAPPDKRLTGFGGIVTLTIRTV